ncbi:MAG TPA: riboflavin synthase [Solirubrobacteraceae bacterium]|nr:riboflavin synthase [Solirubrobacteraceae bacterium]
MFTGLIQDLGRLEAIERVDDGATLRIATALAGELQLGDSIAVNGVCLTATRVRVSSVQDEALSMGAVGATEELEAVVGLQAAGELEAHAIAETLRRSTLGGLAAGDRVNLELALRADGRLGGHIVQGHVDGVGRVVEVREEGSSRVLGIDLPNELLPLVVEKGSIAIDGVSLTVSGLRERGIEVSLIPETLQRTTLGEAAVGRGVNVESDILARHVARLLDYAELG